MTLNMQNNRISAKNIKERVSIVELLTRLGYQPARKTGGQHYYHSMLRDDDLGKPSLAVNDKKGEWYDHGPRYGGNIIEFGLRYWKGLSFPEVLEKIVETCGLPLENSDYYRDSPKTAKAKAPNYGILEIKELGHSAAIMNYLESRGVGRVAEGRLKEVYYYIENDQKKRHNFFAAGWQNETGSWVVRPLSYPVSLGPNAISFLPGSMDRLSVFEGFFDYLSWLTENPFSNDSVLVLNSVSNAQAGITKGMGFGNVTLYFDHDTAGRKATLDFMTAIPVATDGAHIYEGYNDYNDKIVADLGHNGLYR